jgi:hypothetical protein
MTDVSRRQLVAGVVVAGAELLGRGVMAQSRRLFKIGALSESWGPTPAIVGCGTDCSRWGTARMTIS